MMWFQLKTFTLRDILRFLDKRGAGDQHPPGFMHLDVSTYSAGPTMQSLYSQIETIRWHGKSYDNFTEHRNWLCEATYSMPWYSVSMQSGHKRVVSPWLLSLVSLRLDCCKQISWKHSWHAHLTIISKAASCLENLTSPKNGCLRIFVKILS